VLIPTIASISSVYDRAIVDTGRQPEFLFFVAFLITFGFIRTSAHMIKAQISWWPGNVEVGGTHIHHLVWGIVTIMITGYVGVTIAPPSPWQEIIAVFFGIGMGLALDEFALWLDLKDVYWEQQGRKSIDAVIIAATITGLILVGFSAWVDVATDVEDAVFAFVGTFGILAILVALVNLSKERFAYAVLGLFILPVGVVVAFRLARPHSLWARLFYRDGKRTRAEERFGHSRLHRPGKPKPA
jgi:lysyl-tRNA synthetase class 2